MLFVHLAVGSPQGFSHLSALVLYLPRKQMLLESGRMQQQAQPGGCQIYSLVFVLQNQK